MMANHGDADAVGNFSEQKMEWETIQVHATSAGRFKVETARICCGHFNEGIQLCPELIAQPEIDAVVMTENLGNVFLDIRMKDRTHRPRSRSTRRTNSSWEIADTLPEARSFSRCWTSSSEMSVPAGGRVSRSLVTSVARSLSVKASASCSISAIFMRANYRLESRLAMLGSGEGVTGSAAQDGCDDGRMWTAFSGAAHRERRLCYRRRT